MINIDKLRYDLYHEMKNYLLLIFDNCEITHDLRQNHNYTDYIMDDITYFRHYHYDDSLRCHEDIWTTFLNYYKLEDLQISDFIGEVLSNHLNIDRLLPY